ncbi:MAG: hypothetical protein CSA33_03410 [Desulfobulbus propionicus]|nr:MAG: hypothetical protein CSA33_03410 [Desulfobulbus propionicus]
MLLKKILFPEESRHFPGKRWGNIILRCLHLAGLSVYSGGLYFEMAHSKLLPWYLLTAMSGIGLMGLDTYGNGKWLLQNRGLAVLLKLLVLGLLAHTQIPKKWFVLMLIILSGVSSHAPANFRYYSIYHHRVI